MSEISLQELEKLAKLARLNLDRDQAPKLAEELSSILNYVDKLNQIDVSGVEPLAHVQGSKNVFREDTVKQELDPSGPIDLAPERSGAFIKVPLIVENAE
jgi:aspartyl-tRNA(Asn)/glutamyl-tRNA(Gln) amidotransferase subunit C